MTILVTNDAVGALASSINDSVLTIALGTGQGALFPAPGAGEFFYVTIIRATDGAKEIVRCTSRSTDTLTVVRAQDGTTAKAFAASDRVELRPIRAVHLNYPQLDTANSFSALQTFAAGFNATGACDINGPLTVEDVTIDDDLIVGDDVTVGGDLALTGALTVTGTATFNGDLLKGANKVDALPAGVTLLMRQSAVPTGWTKITTWNDAALRIVSGTPSQKADSGDEFTTLFAARTIAQANLPNVDLTAAAGGAHRHFVTNGVDVGGGGSDPTAANYLVSDFNNSNNGSYNLRASAAEPVELLTSESATHTHTVPLGGSGTALAFDVNYVDVYLASKDA